MSDELPEGWSQATIGDIAVVNPPGSTAMALDDVPVTFLPMAAVEELSGHIDLSDHRKFGEVKKGFTRFRDGDVLFAKITPSMENGKVAVVKGLANGIGCGSTEFHVIRPREGVSADYLRYYLVRSAFRQEAKRNMQGAVGQQRVPADFIRGAAIPVAPSTEQTRIVAKIDELFSRVDEGERALEQVRHLVKRYRQSVLKAAVTGELTREWREQRRDELESGEALLQRVLTARREAWERAELDKMSAEGVRPANDKWKQKYSAPATVDRSGLPELPSAWVWTTLDALVTWGPQNGLYLHKSRYGRGTPIVRIDDYQPGWVRSADALQQVDATDEERGKYALAQGDLVINRVNSLSHLGKCLLVGAHHAGCLFESNMMRFRTAEHALASYIELYLRSEFGRKLLTLNCKHAVNQASINQEDVARTPVPLPPLEEQQTIVELADIELTRLANLAASLESNRHLAAGMRQSVLKAAFSGALVSA